MTDQATKMKDSAVDTADKTMGYTGDKAADAQKGTVDASKTAQGKAVETKDQAGGIFQQAGDTVTDTFNNLKNSVTGK